MKILAKVARAIAAPFTAIYVLLWESRETNEDGTWDKYWEKKAERN